MILTIFLIDVSYRIIIQASAGSTSTEESNNDNSTSLLNKVMSQFN